MTIGRLPPTRVQRYCMTLILDHLNKAAHGRLRVSLPDGSIDETSRLILEAADELHETLKRAIAYEGPALVEVMADVELI